jgi:uncharacterized protein (TIGR03437 family)
MPRRIILLLFLCCASAPAATPACIAVPPGLVSWWPGDSNENDIAGENNPSTVTAVSLVPGEVLNGFTFGSQGYIQVPQSPSLENQTFTWAAWVRPDGPGPNNDFVGNNILVNNISGNTDAVALSWSEMGNRFVFIFGNITTSSGYIISNDAFAPGSFYLVAATYDGSVFRLFVNGVLEGSFSQAKTIAYSSSGWIFGSGALGPTFPGFPRTWNGVIDEIQAFNRALSSSELLSIFNAASGGECKGTPAISAGGVVSASAFGGFTSVSPGSWIEIYGSNLAADTRPWSGSDFSGANAPTSLDSTSVTIGGQAAFVDFISPAQVNALVPSNAGTGLQQITVKTAAGTSAPVNVSVNAVQPGLLAPPSFTVNGSQYAVAFFSDGTYVLPTGAIAGLISRPAMPGDTIVLYGVGFGPVIPNIPAGQLVEQSNTLASSFQISVGGQAATVLYSGLAPNYTGLYQFNITVPNVAAGSALPLTFTLGGVAGTQTLSIAVQN